MTAQLSAGHGPVELVPELSTFPDLQIEEWRLLQRRQSKAQHVGQVTTSLITMNDGSRYVRRDVGPAVQSNEVTIEMMTPPRHSRQRL